MVESSIVLQDLSFFEGLSTADRKKILAHFRAEDHYAGEVLFLQGQFAERLYLLNSGQVEIRFKPDDGEEMTIAVIEAGGAFGWSSALGRPSYTSSAVCTADGRCLSIRGRDLRRICEEHPGIGVVVLERLAEVIALRLTSTHEHVVGLLRQGMHPRREVRPS
jgi:CRP-like cAMP-binding protein